MGLYLDDCIKCGKKHETLNPKPNENELSPEGSTLGRCHLCKEIGMFACKCLCGGFCIVNILKQDSIVGTACKFSLCDKVGIFGDKCLCGHMYRVELNEVNMTISYDEEKFLADTGATTHIVKENDCLFKKRSADLCGMKVGTGAVTRVSEKGNLKLVDMNDTEFVLENTYVVPGITRNIISITKLLFEGWQLGGTKDVLTVTKDGKELSFERENSTGLYFIRVQRVDPEETVEEAEVNEATETDENKNAGVDTKDSNNNKQAKFNLYSSMPKLDVNEAHRKWGHPSEGKMKLMAEKAKVILTGSLDQCDACAIAKVKCNSIAKVTETKASKAGERIFIDTSGPFPKSFGGNTYWRGVVDDYSGYMLMDFGNTKDGMVDYIEKVLKYLKGKDKHVNTSGVIMLVSMKG